MERPSLTSSLGPRTYPGAQIQPDSLVSGAQSSLDVKEKNILVRPRYGGALRNPSSAPVCTFNFLVPASALSKTVEGFGFFFFFSECLGV